MSTSFLQVSVSFSEASLHPPICSSRRAVSTSTLLLVRRRNNGSVRSRHLVPCGGGSNFCQMFCHFKQWILKSLDVPKHRRKTGSVTVNQFKILEKYDGDRPRKHLEPTLWIDKQIQDQGYVEKMVVTASQSKGTMVETHSLNFPDEGSEGPSLCIAVIGATGELAKGKIFPALFALYYSGFLPEDVGIFGYSRKNLTDEELRSIIASTLTCRIDHQQNCGNKMDAFLSRTYHINGGFDNKDGMSRLNARMEQIELAYCREDLKQTGYSTFLCHKKPFWMLHALFLIMLKPRKVGIV